jgi:hypothetical protein
LSEGKKEGEINYIFCDDEYLQNQSWIFKHDDLTDIISFDYTLGNEIHGDILFLWNVFRKTRRISKCLWRGNTKSNGSRFCIIADTRTREKRKSYWCALKRMKIGVVPWNSKSYLVLVQQCFTWNAC